METKKDSAKKIEDLKDGEHCYFNMHQDGGAVCYKCNGIYLLFEIPLYGGREQFDGVYFENQINDMVNKAYTWI